MNAHPTTAAPALLETRTVCARMGHTRVLEAVTVQFQAGALSAILGPNGAGKSSLLGLLSGQRAPHQGSVWMNGQALQGLSAQHQARLRALLPQDLSVAFDYSVQDVVALGRFAHRTHPSRQEAAIVQAAMQATGVQALAQRTVNTLSGGERARTQLARVLAQIWEPPANGEARWLLLDEPTAALDLHHQHAVLGLAQRWAQAQGVGVVAVLHDLNLALRYADHVVVLTHGTVHDQGSPQAVLTPAQVQQIWGVSAQAVGDHQGTCQLLMASG